MQSNFFFLNDAENCTRTSETIIRHQNAHVHALTSIPILKIRKMHGFLHNFPPVSGVGLHKFWPWRRGCSITEMKVLSADHLQRSRYYLIGALRDRIVPMVEHRLRSESPAGMQDDSFGCNRFILAVLREAGFILPDDIPTEVSIEAFIRSLRCDIRSVAAPDREAMEKLVRTHGPGVYLTTDGQAYDLMFHAAGEVSYARPSLGGRAVAIGCASLDRTLSDAVPADYLIANLLSDLHVYKWIRGEAL